MADRAAARAGRRRRTDGCCGNDRGVVVEADSALRRGKATRVAVQGRQVGRISMGARKAHSLIGQVYDPRNLARAWQQVKKNKGAGGVDGVTITRFEQNRDHYLDVLHRRLRTGRYRPRPVKRVEIDKPGSTKKRPLGVPTVMDRVCQQALVQVLEPIFEPTCAPRGAVSSWEVGDLPGRLSQRPV